MIDTVPLLSHLSVFLESSVSRKGPNGRQQSKRVASEINLAADPVMVRVCSGAEKRAKGHRSNKTQDSETRPQGEALCYSM